MGIQKAIAAFITPAITFVIGLGFLPEALMTVEVTAAVATFLTAVVVYLIPNKTAE